MKRFQSLPCVLAASALLVGINQSANATLLAGWHDFESDNDNEVADLNATGFSGLLVKGALNSSGLGGVNTGGSNDKHYGDPTNSNPSLFATNNTSDGYLRLLGSGVTPGPTSNVHIFELKNISGGTTSLTDIFFDAANNSTGITVKYQIDSGAITTLGSQTFSNNTLNYSDFSFSLLGVPLLEVGQTIKFIFNQTGGGARIDNIAIAGISAIPEPASLLALGCVLGSGLMLRNRRIKPIQA